MLSLHKLKTGNTGDHIYVGVLDWIAIARVRVVIRNSKRTTLESGWADGTGSFWCYMARRHVRATSCAEQVLD